MNPYGDFRLIQPRQHGMATLPEATDVLIQWDGGQREVINGVTRAYVTEDGRVTLMRGNHAAARLALVSPSKKHRKGRMEATYGSNGQTHTLLSEFRHIF